jgi:hypothetical protein
VFWFLAFLLLAVGAGVVQALILAMVALILIRIAQANGL